MRKRATQKTLATPGVRSPRENRGQPHGRKDSPPDSRSLVATLPLTVPADPLFNLRQAAAYVGYSESTFRRMVLHKDLPGPDILSPGRIRPHGRWRRSSLDAALARIRKGGH